MLVGPWVGTLCVSVVLTVQCLLFADGGLSALGLNIINMALVTALRWVRHLPRCVKKLLPRTRGGVVVAVGDRGRARVRAGCRSCSPSSTRSAATARRSVGTVGAAMIGVHVLIGIGEGVITAMTVAAVLAVRPDLVWGAARPADRSARSRSLEAPVAGRARGVAVLPRCRAARRARARLLREPVCELEPDGLNKVADRTTGFDARRPSEPGGRPALSRDTASTGVARPEAEQGPLRRHRRRDHLRRRLRRVCRSCGCRAGGGPRRR